MAVPMSDEQRNAAAALLRERVPEVAGIGRLFAKHGHELALVGGPVRDVFRGERPSDLDLTTDATPEQVLALVDGWADATWTVGIAFGTVGLRKGSSVFEVTTYRSEQYRTESRKPDVRYGRSLRKTSPAGLHHQRDGGAAARLRARRSVRGPGRAEGEGAAEPRTAPRIPSATTRCGSCARPGSRPSWASPSPRTCARR